MGHTGIIWAARLRRIFTRYVRSSLVVLLLLALLVQVTTKQDHHLCEQCGVYILTPLPVHLNAILAAHDHTPRLFE